LGNAGLFLKQLHSQSKELKQLISPQLGNQVFLASQLLQSAPALQPGNKNQIAALSMGARIKLDPWNAGVSLMKSKPMTLVSARDKMPLAVTALVPYLTRYVETWWPRLIPTRRWHSISEANCASGDRSKTFLKGPVGELARLATDTIRRQIARSPEPH
jgi:hypothetical protein